MTDYQIDFEPIGRRVSCAPGKSVLACARAYGAAIATVCGGHGTCHSCRIQVLEGAMSAPTAAEREAFSDEELRKGWRLACQAYPSGDCRLHVPRESMMASQRTQTEGIEIPVSLEPGVRGYAVQMAPPSIADTKSDAGRLFENLRRLHGVSCDNIDIALLRQLSTRLRQHDWQALAVVRDAELISLLTERRHPLGLAVDLGSTKIAAYLVDLADGRTLAAAGAANPQISYGEDIVSRIYLAVKSPEDRSRLRELVVESINQLAADLCRQAGAAPAEIVDSVVVGNTAMHHLCLGLPVQQMAAAPFLPAICQALDVKTRDVGLTISPGAYVHFLPNIAGFVGADHVAMLLATEGLWSAGLTLALDIGTNTEVALIDKGNITSASCASGPAFEGGHIKDGMRAAGGAIEKVRLLDDRVLYQTIDGAPPVGVCGSGILDAMSQLYLAGMLDAGGRLKGDDRRLRVRRGQTEFVLVGEEAGNNQEAIVITQKDIRELQLAKAAIRTGIQLLLEANGRSEEELDSVIIAGAFGSYIAVSSAMTIGLLSDLPLERFNQVGNAAGMGAKMALVSTPARARARDIASRARYLELAAAPNFNDTFIQATYLGKYRLAHGRREAVR